MTALAYIACTLIWSTTWFAIRVCIGPGGYPTYAAGALRFVLATIILLGLQLAGVAGRGPRTLRQVAWIVGAGLLCALGYGLVYAGETHISGGLAAVIFGTLPLVTALVTFVTRTERPSVAAIGGSMIALAGIALIYRDRMHATAGQATGVALVFASVCVSAGYSLILKRHASDLDPLATNAPFMAATAIGLAAFAFVFERRWPPWPPAFAPTVALVYLGVLGSVIAFAIYFYLLRRMSLTAVSTIVLIEPMLALLIDGIWEHDVRLGARTYAGAALTLVGVGMSLLRRARALR